MHSFFIQLKTSDGVPVSMSYIPHLEVFFSKRAWRYTTAATPKHNLKSIFMDGTRSSEGESRRRTPAMQTAQMEQCYSEEPKWTGKHTSACSFSGFHQTLQPELALTQKLLLPLSCDWKLSAAHKHWSTREWRTTQQQNSA